ncbi:MAG: TonB-dependent receptor [Lacunisphaera sp.]|nr:TonB-dependent receptor [Lacunisphaera sp.]
MRSAPFFLRLLLVGAGGLLPAWLPAAPIDFDLPAQPAAEALLAFSTQAKVEVLYSFDELRAIRSAAVIGRFEPEDALVHLVHDTGFTVRRNAAGKFVVLALAKPTGAVRGRLVGPDGGGVTGGRIRLSAGPVAAITDETGGFVFRRVPPGAYQLTALAPGYQPLRLERVLVEEGREAVLEPQTLQLDEKLTQLEPFVVRDKSIRMKLLDDSAALLGPRRATGNLDLPRSENDALPYTLFTRDQLVRSGVVDLNEFLRRTVLESDAASPTPEQSGSAAGPVAGSTNLNLRSYGANETVVLVNGRRLPEILTSDDSGVLPPDVNFIPLSLIQQVEVLPVSASALYNGNPVGGVINIVLRPDITATELTTVYTNAASGYDAPQRSVSLQHGLTLLAGRLRLRFNAVFTAARPPVESELGLRQAEAAKRPVSDDQLYRATPNVRSSGRTPLFGAGSATFTSVAPGADGTGGLAAFAGRAGGRSLGFFDAPGGLASSLFSLDSPYGRDQQRATFFASATYDPRPWLEVGFDATHSRTLIRRGYQLLTGNLNLAATSPLNPFGQALDVSLNEAAPLLGADYSQSRIDFTSLVGGVLLKLPAEWRVSFDAQYAHNVVKYRGLAGVDATRWQQLVDQGLYQPLRDTQGHGPPAAFYDQVLIYRNGRDHFVTLGNYDTLDAAVRVTNQQLHLPAGRSTVLFGADYRRNHLSDYAETLRYGDGSPAGDPVLRNGRTLQRYSFFGELQAPLLPVGLLPRGLRGIEGDLAARYVAADTAQEANLAPTFGLKVDFARGFTLRGSSTISKRFPTPQMSLPVSGTGGGGTGINQELVFDPVRSAQDAVQADELVNPGLLPESAVTQTAGLIWQRGTTYHVRAALDFVDTRKSNEILFLDAQKMVNVEAAFPGRVLRAPLAPGDAHTAGLITRVITGSVNASWRHSQNWNAAVDYAWTGCLGGTLELRSRLVWFTRYDQQLFSSQPVIDQVRRPDGTFPGLLRYRANLGANWSNPHYSFGVDGQYFYTRLLPLAEQAAQGGREIRPYVQCDAYVQSDITRWFPWRSPHFGLRAQLRVNNVLDAAYPRYANEGTGAGVQPYGDWRGRTYSLSLTAAF